jgi:DNA-binding transcriptional LysR family regulator
LRIPVLQGALTAAVAGMGFVMATTGYIRPELENGSLVQVLPDWDMGSSDMHVVFTAGWVAKPSARALIAYLQEIWQDI